MAKEGPEGGFIGVVVKDIAVVHGIDTKSSNGDVAMVVKVFVLVREDLSEEIRIVVLQRDGNIFEDGTGVLEGHFEEETEEFG